MHLLSANFNVVLKSRNKNYIFGRLVISPFISANQLYNETAVDVCSKNGFGCDTMGRIVSFDSLRSTFHLRRLKFMLSAGILDNSNFDNRDFNSLNDRTSLLNRELYGEKIVVLCDVEFLKMVYCS